MKICCSHLETQIELDVNRPFVLCVENPREYFRTVQEIVLALNGEESDFSFWEGEERIRADKTGEIVTDFFSFELTDRKIMSLLYKRLTQTISDQALSVRFQEVGAAAELFLLEVCSSVNFALEYDALSMETLLKGCSVKPAKSYDSLLEKIVCYLNIFTQLKGISFFAFVGLKSVLDDENLRMLYRHCVLHKISLFLIESKKTRPLLAEERSILLTEDLCELVENFNTM